jgi:uncharacterized membrane protein
MKRFIIAALCMLFTVAAFAMKEPVTDEEKISEVITNYYPNLKDYYEAGVISLAYLTEETLLDGSTEYNIRYKFVKSFYGEDEIDGVLKEKYPQVYNLKRMGLVKNVYVYKFVDGETGEIRTNVGYERVTPRRGFFGRFHARRNG